jgi:hypothetical protein
MCLKKAEKRKQILEKELELTQFADEAITLRKEIRMKKQARLKTIQSLSENDHKLHLMKASTFIENENLTKKLQKTDKKYILEQK